MLFGKKKINVRPGALDADAVKTAIKGLAVNDGATVERVDWDGSRSTVSGRVSHVATDFTSFILVEEGSGESIEFYIEVGDIVKLDRVAISIDLDENQQNTFMEEVQIIELLEALDHGDHISVSYFDVIKGRGVSVKGIITLKDEYNKVFAVEYEENGEKKDKHFNLNEDKIIDIIME